MNRICLNPQQALKFAALPIIESGDADLVDAACKVKASSNPNAHMYVPVQVYGKTEIQTIRIRVGKEID